jgi:hypothetical protein
MSESMAVDELCALVEERARLLGHRLEEWQIADDGGAIARRARCSICGQVAYVRTERGLLGTAGPAFVEPCAGAT